MAKSSWVATPRTESDAPGILVALGFFGTPFILQQLHHIGQRYQWYQIAMTWLGQKLFSVIEAILRPLNDHDRDTALIVAAIVIVVLTIVSLIRCKEMWATLAVLDAIAALSIWVVPLFIKKGIPGLAWIWREVSSGASTVRDETWYKAMAGTGILLLGFSVCIWAFDNRAKLTVGWIGLFAVLAEVVVSSCEHLTGNDSTRGLALYLTTLFVAGFTIKHRLSEITEYSDTRPEDWPPSILGLRR